MTEESAPNITHMQYDAMQKQFGLAPIPEKRFRYVVQYIPLKVTIYFIFFVLQSLIDITPYMHAPILALV